MNTVPRDFYEKVVCHFRKGSVTACCDLSGAAGSIASNALNQIAVCLLSMRNGRQRKKKIRMVSLHKQQDNGRLIQIDGIHKNLFKHTEIAIGDDREGQSEADESANTGWKLPEIINNKNVFLYLDSPWMGKLSEQVIKSIRFPYYLFVYTSITDQNLKILEILVRKRTLNVIRFLDTYYYFDENSAKLLVALLKQEQFYEAFFSNNCYISLKDIIAEWKANPDSMTGKRLTIQGYSLECFRREAEVEVEACTDDEKRFMITYCGVKINNDSKMFVLRGKNERNMYVNTSDETLILFA